MECPTVSVLILCEFSSLNGGERSLLSVLPHLATQGIEATVACPSGGDLALSLEGLDIPIVPFQIRDQRGQRRAPEAIQQSLKSLIHETSPAAVHANSLSMARLLGSVARDCQPPCLGHLRDIIRISRAAADRLNRLDRLLAVSAAVQQWYLPLGVAAKKMKVVHNGVDLQQFAPRPKTGYLHRELGLADSSLLVGAIGQIGMRKGLDVLMQAVSPTVGRHAEVHLLLVGQRYSQKDEAIQYEAQLRHLATTKPLHSHVHFLGVRDDVATIMNELDVLIHAARQEPLGRVLLEAAASGLSIVVTDVGGTKEIFPPESNAALLVPPESPPEITTALESLIRNPTLRQQMGRRARSRAESVFAAQKAAEHLARQYREAIDEAHSSA
jgi:glycosyltransferase involved in cell wall biosynthesis